MKASLEEVGISILAYDAQFGYFRTRLDPAIKEKQREALLKLIRHAYDEFRK